MFTKFLLPAKLLITCPKTFIILCTDPNLSYGPNLPSDVRKEALTRGLNVSEIDSNCGHLFETNLSLKFELSVSTMKYLEIGKKNILNN